MKLQPPTEDEVHPETEREYLREIRDYTKTTSTVMMVLLVLFILAVAVQACTVLF